MDKNNSPLINIENLHIHMDERMDSMNFYHPEKDGSDCCDDCFDCECRDCPGHPGCCCPGGGDEVEVDMDELVEEIHKEMHLPVVIIERVLAAESKILARLGVATEVHVVEDDEEDTTAEDVAKDQNDSKADAHKVAERVFPAIAGLMMVGLLKEMCGAKDTATNANTEADQNSEADKNTDAEG